MAKMIQSFLADINGDGVLDFVYVDSDHRWTAVNGTTGRTDDIPSFPPGHTIPGWPCWGRYFFADFTGDRIADRAYFTPDGKWHVINGASGAPGVDGIPWGSQIPGWPGSGRISVTDFDGDGRAERCYLAPDGGWFVANSQGGPGIPGIPWGSKIPGWPGDGHYFIADFNGDGAADRLYVSPDGGWYAVDSKTGSPGMPGLPWAHTIPGWPGGGRYTCFDFNGDGVIDRCYIHPSGQAYVVDTPSGAPMQGVPHLGNWGDALTDTGRIVLDVIAFQATSAVCAYTLGSAWLACFGAIKAAYETYADLREIVQKNKSREQSTNQRRNSSYDRDREPYLRCYPPQTTGPHPTLEIGELKVHDEPNCREAGVSDCPERDHDTERPDHYNDHSRGDDRRLHDFTHDEKAASKSILSLRSAAVLTMIK